ncbi:MAG: hypothetical protein RL077_4435 [Verrucomicrobiota bacterium]|jgi:hypothetical protein
MVLHPEKCVRIAQKLPLVGGFSRDDFVIVPEGIYKFSVVGPIPANAP